MLHRLVAVAVAGVVSLLAVAGVAGHSRFSGPVLLELDATHGMHRDDLAVFALWVVGVGLSAVVWLLAPTARACDADQMTREPER